MCSMVVVVVVVDDDAAAAKPHSLWYELVAELGLSFFIRQIRPVVFEIVFFSMFDFSWRDGVLANPYGLMIDFVLLLDDYGVPMVREFFEDMLCLHWKKSIREESGPFIFPESSLVRWRHHRGIEVFDETASKTARLLKALVFWKVLY